MDLFDGLDVAAMSVALGRAGLANEYQSLFEENEVSCALPC